MDINFGSKLWFWAEQPSVHFTFDDCPLSYGQQRSNLNLETDHLALDLALQNDELTEHQRTEFIKELELVKEFECNFGCNLNVILCITLIPAPPPLIYCSPYRYSPAKRVALDAIINEMLPRS